MKAKLGANYNMKYDGNLAGHLFSLEYTTGHLTLTGEYTRTAMNQDIDIGFGFGFEKTPELPGEGWYIKLAYRFTSFFEAGVTYSEYYPEKTNKDGKTLWVSNYITRTFRLVGTPRNDPDFTAWLKTTTGSLRFDLNQNWTAKLEVSYNDGFGTYTSAYNEEGSLNRYWLLYAAKLSFMF